MAAAAAFATDRKAYRLHADRLNAFALFSHIR